MALFYFTKSLFFYSCYEIKKDTTAQRLTLLDSILLIFQSWIDRRKMKALNPYNRDVKLIFTGGHISLVVAYKGPNAISGLYKCNYSLTVK